MVCENSDSRWWADVGKKPQRSCGGCVRCVAKIEKTQAQQTINGPPDFRETTD
jgi:hypothetical protein